MPRQSSARAGRSCQRLFGGEGGEGARGAGLGFEAGCVHGKWGGRGVCELVKSRYKAPHVIHGNSMVLPLTLS
jgi:hypothetical protein